MEKPWKVVFAFAGVFVAGAVFGGFFMLRSHRAPEAPPSQPRKEAARGLVAPAMTHQLVQRLNLTDDQQKNIQPVVARAEEELLRLRRQNFQETSQVMARMHADLSVLLTSEQREKLETLKHNMRERLRRAQETKERRGDFSRGGQWTGTPDTRPTGETTAVDERKGN